MLKSVYSTLPLFRYLLYIFKNKQRNHFMQQLSGIILHSLMNYANYR